MSLAYRAYGLHLQTNDSLPGLEALTSAPKIDVEISLQSNPPVRLDGDQQMPWYVSPYQDDLGRPTLKAWKLSDGEFYGLRYSDGTEFVIDSAGTRIWSTWPDSLTLDDTAVYLLGPILGFILRLRGTVSLHASAISVDGRAIAFLGPAGAGKSTTAAGFAQLGFPVLSDDVLALTDMGGAVLVQPAYPHIRLWPSAVSILYGSPDNLPRLVPGDSPWDKRYLNLGGDDYEFQENPLPLAAIYLLGEREEAAAPRIELIPESVGLMSLVTNTYANYLLDASMRAQEFGFLSRIMSSIPFRRVIPHVNPSYLSQLRSVILDDYRGLRA
jgi:hypothetical protein